MFTGETSSGQFDDHSVGGVSLARKFSWRKPGAIRTGLSAKVVGLEEQRTCSPLDNAFREGLRRPGNERYTVLSIRNPFERLLPAVRGHRGEEARRCMHVPVVQPDTMPGEQRGGASGCLP